MTPQAAFAGMAPTVRSACALGIAAAALLLGGCVGFSPDGGMAPVVATVADRLDKDVAKVADEAQAETARDRAARLLRKPLTVDRAVQVAFLRNRALQASFYELGVSEAAFVRASLPPEPRFSLDLLTGMGDLETVSQVAGSLFALATLPARQAIASEQFKAAQWRTAGEVMALAAEVGRQFYVTVAAQDQNVFLDRTVSSARAAAELAKQLGEAGNLNKLEQARQDAFYTEVGAQFANSKLQARAERERLTRLLGLWGPEIEFKLPKGLPPLPPRIDTERNVEAKALTERLDLRAGRHDLDALARQLGLTTATRYVSDVNLSYQHDDEHSGDTGGSKLGTENRSRLIRDGFTADFTIPIYDFGESKVRGARETYLAAASRLAQRAIDARSQAREAYTRYRGSYDLARYYADRVLPLQKTILGESAVQTNGMLIDVTQLLIDARARVVTNGSAITARRDFFIAAVDLKAALVGNGLGPASPSPAPVTGTTQASN